MTRRFIASTVIALVTETVMLGCGREPRSDGPTGDRAAVEAVASELPELIGAFGKPKTAADEIPGDEEETLAQLGANARPGESPQFSRRLELAGGEYAYVWPYTDGVCKAWDTSTGCAPTRLLEERGVIVAFSARRDSPADETFDVSVFALARDGIEDFELVLTDGRALTPTIRENGALIRLTEVPVEARWRNPDGSAGSQAVVPPGAEAVWNPAAAAER